MRFLDAEVSLRIDRILAATTDNFCELAAIAGLSPAQDFRHKLLRDVDFNGSNLATFDFTGTTFQSCRFGNARFGSANLIDVDFRDCNPEEALDWKSVEHLVARALPKQGNRPIQLTPSDGVGTSPPSYFFCGIGGSGMLPLASIVRAQGAEVAGSDRLLDQGRLSDKFAYLERQGIGLHPQDGSGLTGPEQILVTSAAVEESVPDVQAARRIGAEHLTRPQLVAHLFNAAPLSIGIAGTSGKSTVTGMIAWILHEAGLDPTVMNGAVMKNFVTADAPFGRVLAGRGGAFVSEIDESDGSIALYEPRIALLNNVSLDHKTIEELRSLFAGFLARAGTAVVNLDDAEARAIGEQVEPNRLVTFSLSDAGADLVGSDIGEEPLAVSLNVRAAGGEAVQLRLQVPGRHNAANALAALAAARAAGVPLAEGAKALAGFTGLRRRFDVVGTRNGISVIDDFGHNPDKIAASLQTLHAFPGRLLVMFQPHGYGPLKVLREALVACFVDNLGPADMLLMPDPVFHGGTVAREVTSADVVAAVRGAGRRAEHCPDREACRERLRDLARPGDRIIVMGARDDTLSVFAAELFAGL